MAEENVLPNLAAALWKKVATPAQIAVAAFYAQCPAFLNTSENWHILVAFLPEEFDRELKYPTTQQLIDAYHLAQGNGHFLLN